MAILGNLFGNRRSHTYNIQHIWPEGMTLPFPKDPKYLNLVFFDVKLYRESEFCFWPEACSSDGSNKGYNLVNFRSACDALSPEFLKYVCPGSAGLPFSFDGFKENAKAVFRRKLPKAVVIQYHGGEFVYYDISQSRSRDILPDVLNLIYALPWLKEPLKGPVTRDRKGPAPHEEDISKEHFRGKSGEGHGRPGDEQDIDENEALIKEFLSKYEQLRKIGISDEYIQSLLSYKRKASRLRITSQGRLFLVDYDNAEVRMDSLSKAVYLLYLKHPEGIRFKALADHYDELYHLYSKLSNRSDLNALMASVSRLVDPEDNSINEKTSKANRAFNAVMDESAAKAYYIEGAKGEDKSISIDRSLIIWEI